MTDSLQRLTAALADRYAVERELGSGGMATVYLAEDLKHRRPVAVKVLRPELSADLGSERFLREIETASKLQHPHILPLFDSGAAGDLLYYVMPYVEGETLADRLARDAELPLDEALRIAEEVAGALQYAHDHGLVHRDIKPANIMLTGGHAVVSDFGIALAVSAAGGERITATGIAVGTPAYMSPEQATGIDAIDGRSDLYALGCVLYEMLVGQPPFTGPTAQSLLAKHATESPPSVRMLRETVPEHVEAVIARALSKHPADRFPSGDAFCETLRTPRAPTPTATTMPPVAKLALMVASLLLLAVVGVILFNNFVGDSSGETGGPPRVAVLPFENLGSPDDEFFADGITEEITSRLAEMSGLSVKSRTSAKRYKGSDDPIPEIGRVLQVDYILEGTVRTDRDAAGQGQVRVTPQLIRVSDDSHLWTDRFDATLAPGSIFGVQGDIAEEVASALNVTLVGNERQQVRRAATESEEALRLYQQGRFFWDKRDPESVARARELFEQAISYDSAYAEAHAGLADAIAIANFYDPELTAQGFATWAPAEAAARRAIALDPELAEAHASLGLALGYGSWDWDGAEQAYTRAIQLDPDYAEAHLWLGEIRMVRNDLDSAVAAIRRAIDKDPLTSPAWGVLSWALLALSRGEEALETAREAYVLQPQRPATRFQLVYHNALLGRVDEARAASRELYAIVDPTRQAPEETLRAVADLFAGRVDAATASRAVASIRAFGLAEVLGAYGFAVAGFPDSAFALLDVALESRDEILPIIRPLLEMELGEDPKWPSVLARLGLE